MYRSKTEINKLKIREKYKSIYNDVQRGMSFEEIHKKKKYGYKNVHTLCTTYYQYILPYIDSLPVNAHKKIQK